MPANIRIFSREHSLRKIVLTVFVLAILLAVPVHILVKGYYPGMGFLRLIDFGKDFRATRLEAVSRIHPPTVSQIGYDGQFYAQLALDPLLLHPETEQALDNPGYRARRIGLPVLAFSVGAGKPWKVLNAYAILNFVFWLLLLGLLAYFIGLQRPRDMLLAVALLWSTGTLLSVRLSLTDLPAAVLSVLAVFLGRRWLAASFLMGGAALIKDTAALSFLAIPWRSEGKPLEVRRLLLSGAIMVVPLFVWIVYVNMRITSGAAFGNNNLALPAVEIVHKVLASSREIITGYSHRPVLQMVRPVFELLGTLSLCAQAAYLFVRPRMEDAAWRMGIGFALLLLILGESVWVVQDGYCRTLLPLTFSFNLLLHKYESGKRFAAWYGAGNIGMFWMVIALVLRTA